MLSIVTDAPTSLRIVRAKEVDRLTGTHASQRNRLEAAGKFPRRVKITTKAVGWIEGEIVAWIKGRMALRDQIEAYEANLPPGARHRLRVRREREGEEPAPAEAG
jgi:prophage regulatory protein